MKKIFITADSFGLCDFIREKNFKRCMLTIGIKIIILDIRFK